MKFIVAEGRCEIRERREMRAAIKVDKGNMTERPMDLLYIMQMARLTIKVYEKLKDMLMKFIPFSFRQTDELLRNIPEKANKSCYKGETFITFFIMPRNTRERCDRAFQISHSHIESCHQQMVLMLMEIGRPSSHPHTLVLERCLQLSRCQQQHLQSCWHCYWHKQLQRDEHD